MDWSLMCLTHLGSSCCMFSRHFNSLSCGSLACMRTVLTHWGRVTHICVGKLTIIASDNGLSPGRRQAIIWTNAGILLIGPLGTNFNEISFGIQTFSLKKMHFKMSSSKWGPFCLGLNVLSSIPRKVSTWAGPCVFYGANGMLVSTNFFKVSKFSRPPWQAIFVLSVNRKSSNTCAARVMQAKLLLANPC